MSATNSDALWTPTFVMLCAAQFLGYAQHAMLAPVLPLYVTHLGGSAFMVGLVLAAFAVFSVLVRPVAGHWADRWSDAGVMISGLVFQGASVLLCLFPSISAAMLANGLRGVGWAGLNTGGYSLLAFTAPQTRRGEASGLYSGVQSASAILFPAFALWLLEISSGVFDPVFLTTAVLSWLGAAIGLVLTRYLARPTPHSAPAQTGPSWWREIFHFIEPGIFLPSLMLLWLNISLPAITNFSVLYASELGIANFGTYFIALGVTSLLGRPFLGRLSDRIGRYRSIATGFALQVLALLWLTAVTDLVGVIVVGALYMLGNAIGSSTILALAVERTEPQRRGKQMATFSIAYPLSYGVGSMMIGAAAEAVGYKGMFVLLTALQALGLIFVIFNAASLMSRARDGVAHGQE
jgi:MFS family permease